MPEPLLGIRSDDQGRTETIDPVDQERLPALCAKIHARISAFLAVEASTERLKQVQEQTRLSLKVIEEALERYRCDQILGTWKHLKLTADGKPR